MEPYRSAPTSDIYALYLRTYIATASPAGGAIPTGNGTREEQAIALAIEDALIAKAAIAGIETLERDDKCYGYRERWQVLQVIEKHEAAEPPPCDDEEDE